MKRVYEKPVLITRAKLGQVVAAASPPPLDKP
jgi:hypothetical protein